MYFDTKNYLKNNHNHTVKKSSQSEAPTAKAEDSQALHDNIPFQI
jgi:hypothetical protein